MSIKTIENVEGGGEKRQKTGPKLGSGEMRQICVTVQKSKWNTALSIWTRERWARKPSWLVDKLIERYVDTGGRILDVEAA